MPPVTVLLTWRKILDLDRRFLLYSLATFAYPVRARASYALLSIGHRRAALPHGRQAKQAGIRTNLSPDHLRQGTNKLRRSIHALLNSFLVDDFPDREPEGGFEALYSVSQSHSGEQTGRCIPLRGLFPHLETSSDFALYTVTAEEAKRQSSVGLHSTIDAL